MINITIIIGYYFIDTVTGNVHLGTIEGQFEGFMRHRGIFEYGGLEIKNEILSLVLQSRAISGDEVVYNPGVNFHG